MLSSQLRFKGLRRTFCAVERARSRADYVFSFDDVAEVHAVTGAFIARQLTTVLGSTFH